MRPGLAASLALLPLVFFGCAKPPPLDPLDWKVRAKSPAELDDWLAEIRPKVPRPLATEIDDSLRVIAGNIPYYKGYNRQRYEASDDPLCLAVNQHTIRQLIADGYDASNDSLRLEINRNLENRIRNLELGSQTDDIKPRQKIVNDWNLRFEGNVIERDERMMAVYRARIAALEEPADASD